MTHSTRLFAIGVGVLAVLLPRGTHADDPGALPPPRAKAPPALTLPADAPKAPAAPTKPAAPVDGANAAGAELPRPAGKPGRAPDPDGAKKDAKKDDAKKEPPPPDGRCDECGSCVCVAKVCVPTPKEKEITKVCWDTKCEDFCVPGRSEWCGTKCGKDECGCWSHEIWKPTCAEVRTRVVPVRKTTKRKVPSVEWKVVERCACCRAKAPCGATPKPAGGEKKLAADASSASVAAGVPDGDGPPRTAARPDPTWGFTWPWATWLR